MEDILYAKPKLHVFVCTNDQTVRLGNTTPSCGPTITDDDLRDVKRWVQDRGWVTDVYCTKVKCLGFCNPVGGVMCVYPKGRFVKGLQNVEDIKRVIEEEMKTVL